MLALSTRKVLFIFTSPIVSYYAIVKVSVVSKVRKLVSKCRLKCSYEFIPRRFAPKIRYKDLVRLRKTKRV